MIVCYKKLFNVYHMDIFPKKSCLWLPFNLSFLIEVKNKKLFKVIDGPEFRVYGEEKGPNTWA